ncbi:DUF2381 family protein [Archangium sp.]|uniref:DUF2381 family protein n=1 Tax=Archangium sp. TaxID=1872627 RepID=UPI00286D0373|nr:DUF2381 family protein [Archangium sp.]
MAFTLLTGPLALALLATAPNTAEPPLPNTCETASPQIELTARRSTWEPVVCISPDVPLTLRFNAPLQPGSEKLEQRERFGDVAPGKTSLMLVPPETMGTGERFRLKVCFSDEAAPACATFLLLAHPGLGMREVKVSRQPSPVAYYQQVAREAQDENQRLSEEVRRLRAEREVPEGMRGAVASGWMGTKGIACTELMGKRTPPKGNALYPDQVFGCRANGSVAVLVDLTNPGTEPWTAAGAVLRGAQGEVLKPLPLWQSAPIVPSRPGIDFSPLGRVVVEVVATENEARGTYTLTLWDAEQQRTVTLGNITFP